MAKKKLALAEQMNVRVNKEVLKSARQYVKKNKSRLGILVTNAMAAYLQANQ